MARVSGVPINYLFTRGQQIRVAIQIYKKARKHGFVIPMTRHIDLPGDKFEGAFVIEPKKGYYKTPIATLDFASLYPSIMMAHNLCYTTLVPRNKAKFYELGKDITQTPNGDFFVPREKRRGILPLILEELVESRNKVKERLKNT